MSVLGINDWLRSLDSTQFIRRGPRQIAWADDRGAGPLTRTRIISPNSSLPSPTSPQMSGPGGTTIGKSRSKLSLQCSQALRFVPTVSVIQHGGHPAPAAVCTPPATYTELHARAVEVRGAKVAAVPFNLVPPSMGASAPLRNELSKAPSVSVNESVLNDSAKSVAPAAKLANQWQPAQLPIARPAAARIVVASGAGSVHATPSSEQSRDIFLPPSTLAVYDRSADTSLSSSGAVRRAKSRSPLRHELPSRRPAELGPASSSWTNTSRLVFRMPNRHAGIPGGYGLQPPAALLPALAGKDTVNVFTAATHSFPVHNQPFQHRASIVFDIRNVDSPSLPNSAALSVPPSDGYVTNRTEGEPLERTAFSIASEMQLDSSGVASSSLLAMPKDESIANFAYNTRHSPTFHRQRMPNELAACITAPVPFLLPLSDTAKQRRSLNVPVRALSLPASINPVDAAVALNYVKAAVAPLAGPSAPDTCTASAVASLPPAVPIIIESQRPQSIIRGLLRDFPYQVLISNGSPVQVLSNDSVVVARPVVRPLQRAQVQLAAAVACATRSHLRDDDAANTMPMDNHDNRESTASTITSQPAVPDIPVAQREASVPVRYIRSDLPSISGSCENGGERTAVFKNRSMGDDSLDKTFLDDRSFDNVHTGAGRQIDHDQTEHIGSRFSGRTFRDSELLIPGERSPVDPTRASSMLIALANSVLQSPPRLNRHTGGVSASTAAAGTMRAMGTVPQMQQPSSTNVIEAAVVPIDMPTHCLVSEPSYSTAAGVYVMRPLLSSSHSSVAPSAVAGENDNNFAPMGASGPLVVSDSDCDEAVSTGPPWRPGGRSGLDPSVASYTERVLALSPPRPAYSSQHSVTSASSNCNSRSRSPAVMRANAVASAVSLRRTSSTGASLISISAVPGQKLAAASIISRARSRSQHTIVALSKSTAGKPEINSSRNHHPARQASRSNASVSFAKDPSRLVVAGGTVASSGPKQKAHLASFAKATAITPATSQAKGIEKASSIRDGSSRAGKATVPAALPAARGKQPTPKGMPRAKKPAPIVRSVFLTRHRSTPLGSVAASLPVAGPSIPVVAASIPRAEQLISGPSSGKGKAVGTLSPTTTIVHKLMRAMDVGSDW